ncbi:MAG: MBL fold metallo-hydrolase, partial [Acidobacteria bacterium]|nr:MBL fold metallo-hydrolase [Acidobacteriota bacterium]
VYAFNPQLGIAAEWARLLTERLQDEAYQRTACASFRQQLFLHQAVLSAVISARVKPGRIRPLPLSHGYPFTQHGQLDPSLQVSSFNALAAVIFDYAWDKIPTWLDRLDADEPLRQWLFDTYLAYLKLDDNLYRMEGSCNSYLVTTPAGSVLIDPAGATAAPQYFRKLLAGCPLQAILLTHAHQDHWGHLDVWLNGADIPVIAQREFITYNEYCERLAPFYARRAAIWARRPLPAPDEVEPLNAPVPTVTFADEYTYELGGVHFRMVHTPGETPDHTTIWIPELRAVFVGDNYYEYFINNATLRGTNTRPVLGYIAALDLALSYKPAWFLMGHGSPVVTPDLVQRTVTDFRDALQYVHDETIRGINAGQDVHTLMREIRLPDKFNVRPYFGQVHWTVRGIYHENIGWFEENPADMYDVPASSIYPDLVDLAGADAILDRAKALIGSREYVLALRLTDVVLAADPQNRAAHELRLAALEGLKAGTANYIERIWLDYGIRLAKESLDQ